MLLLAAEKFRDEHGRYPGDVGTRLRTQSAHDPRDRHSPDAHSLDYELDCNPFKASLPFR